MKPQGIFLFMILIFGQMLPASAVTTNFWEQRTSADFEKGTAENVAITSDGNVVLSPQLTQISEDLSELYIWALAADSKGNLYAGTGNNGKIFKITPEGEVSVFMDSPQVSILSLIFDKKGNLYAGTSPDGLIYKIEPNGSATTFYQTEQRYVWSLAFDAADHLFAGTGTRGKIFRIAPDGTGDEWYDARETHIMTLLYRNQTLYAGGAGYGLIYKITEKNKGFVLHDAPEEEIHTLTMDTTGNLYAGSIPVNFLDAPPTPVERHSSGDSDNPDGRESGMGEFSLTSNQQSSVYRVAPDGNVDRIWQCPEPLILSMLVDDQGDLLVGTGNNGSLYRVRLNDHRRYTRLLKSRDSQLLAMIQSPKDGKVYIATGNLGRLYELTTTLSDKGTLESNVYDSKFFSRWGVIEWEDVTPEGTSITVATRTGNTETPDDTWSDWSAELTARGKITSPPARFVQWRTTLTTTKSLISPDLYTVSLAFLPDNLSPVISSISVYTAGESVGGADANEGTTPSPVSDSGGKKGSGDSALENGLSTAKWECTDPNGDDLSYTLYFRGKGESNWKLLAKELTRTEHSWNTDVFPDGIYQLKIVATDSVSNPVNLAKTTEYFSRDFTIDNAPPAITIAPVKSVKDGATIDVTVIDAVNRIQDAHYSVDGNEWQLIFPADLILDQLTEAFTISIANLGKGEHTLVFRASDLAGNIGTQKTVFTVQ